MPTAWYLTGFEHGLAAPVISGDGLFAAVNGTPTIQGTTKRTGDYALRIYVITTGAACNVTRSISGSRTVMVGRVYFYFTTLPSGTAEIVNLACNAGVALKFNITSGYIHGVWGTADVTGPAISTGVWYRLDFKADCSASPRVCNWKVDGNVQTDISIVAAATTFSTWYMGWLTSVTGEMFIDDVFLSVTGADYPIGPGGVLGLRPDADGTHNNAANIMEDSAGNDIDGVTYFAYDKLDESPWTTGAAADYVRQTANGTGNYCEVQFADTTQVIIHGAMGILQYASATATANRGACIIRDSNGQETEIWGNPTTTQDYSETTPFYKSVIIAMPSDGWTMAHVNALRSRFGYSGDAAPDPYWLAMILEVAYGTEHLLVVAESGHAHAIDAITLTQAHTLAVARADHSNAADSPVLTEHKTLVVQAGDHAQAIDSPSLIQNQSVIVQEAAHANEADEPVLTQAHVLTVDEADHAHEGEAPVLIQQHTIAVAESAHAQTTESPALTQAHVLAVAEVLHPHAADILNLLQQHFLAIDEVAHGHPVDSPVLIQAHLLAVAEALHPHSSDAINLVQAHNLAVMDGAHAHTTDGITLTQHHILIAQEAGHVHSVDNVVLEVGGLVTLIISDGQHAFWVDSPALIQAHILSIASADHIFGSDSLIITEHEKTGIEELEWYMTALKHRARIETKERHSGRKSIHGGIKEQRLGIKVSRLGIKQRSISWP